MNFILRSFIAGLGVSNTIRAFKIVKKDESNMQISQAAVQDFPQVTKLICKKEINF
jgi:hypothetical protein